MYGTKFENDYSTALDDLKAERAKVKELNFTIETNN